MAEGPTRSINAVAGLTRKVRRKLDSSGRTHSSTPTGPASMLSPASHRCTYGPVPTGRYHQQHFGPKEGQNTPNVHKRSTLTAGSRCKSRKAQAKVWL